MYGYIFIIPILFWFDQATKKKALSTFRNKEEQTVLGGRIVLTLHKNPGAMLGFLKKYPLVLLGLQVSFIFLSTFYFIYLIFQEGRTFWKWAFVFIIGGGLGNLWDRIHKGYVIDFFRYSKSRIVYNMADFFIFLGGFLGIIAEFVEKK
ncbi:MAG: signal peptidase II [Epulopiscium sp.]|nr:signal peptidase II [Candidatus Epulonipiscium sp.]